MMLISLAPRVGLELFHIGEQRSPLFWGEEVELAMKVEVRLLNFVW